MAAKTWPTRRISVAALLLDTKNPRLGRETSSRAPRDIIQHLFEHDKAMEIAHSIASRGYFPNEPLLAIKADRQFVVVEGNRRLAALKALREPVLLEGRYRRQLERVSRQVEKSDDIAKVPVTIAPSRKATDKQIVGRHLGTPVLPWRSENRASFILDKLSEGYTNKRLKEQLGFTLADIQSARQTRAIAEMTRSLDLSRELKARIESPRAKLFTTLERVFASSVGREYLMVEPDSDHGLRGATTKEEFLRGFTKLVEDIALGRQSSRTLNTNEDIREYFDSWGPKERPIKKSGSFVPADVIQGRSVASPVSQLSREKPPKKGIHASRTVLPRDFKVVFGNERLREIRNELIRLKREEFPNAGAVLLRVFFELAVIHYLERTGELKQIIQKLEAKENRRLPYGVPTLRQLASEIRRVAKRELPRVEALKVEKAVRYDPSAPFTLSELHTFVHQTDLPSPRDIQVFWNRTEPLFRLMLERAHEVT